MLVAALALALAVGGVLGWLVAESADDSGGTTTVTSVSGTTVTTTEVSTVTETETETETESRARGTRRRAAESPVITPGG